MRVRDQVVYMARLHGHAESEAAAAADRWIERLGLTERAGARTEELSLGNQQRVQLATALVHDPEVLVLDEPFSGLDPVGVDVMSGVLQELAAGGVPVVFSSHQLDLVERLCEAVAIIREGRLVASGQVEQLRDRGRRDRRVRVAVEGDGDGAWLGSVPGAEVVERGRSGLLVRLDDGADPDRVLDAARAAGTVVHFSLDRPTLTDLFREVVVPQEAAA
jgi:ABC-2 type transport system ATP-binding protein